MHTPHAILLRGGERLLLQPGDLLGRAITAAGRINDLRVSEGHAMLTLRGGELRLLALRGALELDGEPDDDFPLAAGQRIRLAEGVELEVESVILPDHVLGLQPDGAGPWLLHADQYSLCAEPVLHLVPRYLPDAIAWLWSDPGGWSIARPAGAGPQPLRVGTAIEVEGRRLVVIQVPVTAIEAAATMGAGNPMQLRLRYTSVHIHRPGRHITIIEGLPAQLLTELVQMRTAPWELVARQLWPEPVPRQRLRHRWDRVRQRLTALLRDNGIREDIVRTDGRGNFEILLGPDDEVIDET